MTLDERCMRLTDALATEIRRRQQVESENAALRTQLEAQGHAIDLILENADLRARVADLTEKIESMNFRLYQLARRVFGRSSERHHPDQQHLDEIMRQILVEQELHPVCADPTPILMPEGEAASTAVTATTPEASPTTGGTGTAPLRQSTTTRPRAKRRGRMALPDSLPIDERVVEVPESERLGPDGTPLPQIGTRVVMKLDYIPPGFQRLKLIYPIFGVPFSDEPRVMAKPLPCIVPKGLPTDATVAAVLVEKYDFHCPLYRQETRWERVGIDLSRSTLMNWVRHGAEALAPIHQAIGASILTSPVIGLDDTWIRVLDPGAGETHQSRLWGYYANDEFYCDYERTREGKWPQVFLEDYVGVIMADAYAGHHRLFDSPNRIAAACMAHARRKYEEALSAGELDASQAMDHFSLLYLLEEELRPLTPDARRARRQAEAVPVLNRLESLLTRWIGSHRPSSGVWKAARYTLRIFPQLRVYTTDGRIPIDNNDLERLWRQPSLNRKNSLFVGSDRGGGWAATMFTICQCCRLIDLDPYRYLVEVFAELHSGRTDYESLRPKAWVQRQLALRA